MEESKLSDYSWSRPGTRSTTTDPLLLPVHAPTATDAGSLNRATNGPCIFHSEKLFWIDGINNCSGPWQLGLQPPPRLPMLPPDPYFDL